MNTRIHGLIICLLTGFYGSAQVNPHAYLQIGQKDFHSDSVNQGSVVNANTLNSPAQVLVVAGKLIIADAQNNRVLIFDSVPVVSDASANVVIGQEDFLHGLSNRSGPTSSITLDRPAGLGSDGTRLFVLDRDNHRVLIFNAFPDSNSAAADIVIGQRNMNEDTTGGESVFNDTARLSEYRFSTGPTGMFYDKQSGKLIVSDSDNDRVMIYNAMPDSNWAPADVVIGQADFYHNKTNQGGPVAANTLDLSTAAAVSVHYGKLFVCDRQNNRVLIFNQIPQSNNAMADVVIGQADFSTNLPNRGGSTSAAGLKAPRSVTVDKYGRLYIADNGNSRILVYNSIPSINGATADAVIGQDNFTGNIGSVSDSTIKGVYHILADENRLIVSDAGNNRVLFFEITAPQAMPGINLSAISVFPNPCSDLLHFAGSGQNALLKIYKLNGTLLREETLQDTGEISLNSFLPGLYFYEISRGGLSYRGKFIKN